MSTLDPQFINPFLNSTLEALRVTCNVDVNPGKPFVKGGKPQPEFQLGAILGIISPSFSGSITLLFSDSVYKKIVSGWLGEEIETLTKDHLDGVAELLNIIFGGAKVAWNEQGRSIQKAIPTFISGTPIRTESKLPVLVVPFVTRFGEFHVEICSDLSVAQKAS